MQSEASLVDDETVWNPQGPNARCYAVRKNGDQMARLAHAPHAAENPLRGQETKHQHEGPRLVPQIAPLGFERLWNARRHR